MMRTRAAFGFGAAALLATSGAWAAEGKGDVGTKSQSGIPTTTTTVQPDTNPAIVPLSDAQKNTNPDLAKKVEERKSWDVGATFETHRLIRQDDLEGAGANKVFNAFGLFADYRLSQRDILTIRDYFTEDFLADQGETGVRSGDVTLSYTHIQPLPKDFTLSGTVALSAPTSFQSQKASQITDPTLILAVDKKFGRYVNFVFRISAGFLIDKYAEAEGGAANPEFHLGGTLGAQVIMPFHEPLMIGVDATTQYTWFYNVQSGDPNVVSNGVVQDNQFSDQPIQQNYGGEVFARYTLPSLAGVKSDIQVALAQGDPTLGYTAFLHDGVGYTYLFFRQTSEVYASFSVSY